MAMRGEERGIGYIGLEIDIRPPLQEKRGGGSLTIGTSKDQSTPAILQRENQRYGNERKGESRREGEGKKGRRWNHERRRRKDWSAGEDKEEMILSHDRS
jgi:hypothetical protein